MSEKTIHINLACIEGDIRSVVDANEDVRKYRKHYVQTVEPLFPWLEEELVKNPIAADSARMEQIISDRLFKTLEGIKLVDPYDAYQALDDIWEGSITLDLEVLQTEGMIAATKVDPNMVIKKKNNKDVEVQDGWIGRIIPFELIERELLSSESSHIKGLENDLSSCVARIEQSVEELSEEDKEMLTDALNDDNSEWKSAGVNKALKALSIEAKTDSELMRNVSLLKEVQSLFDKQKRLKSEIKKAKAQLEASCKEAIESLTAEQVRELLLAKWVVPFMSEMYSLPEKQIDKLVSRIEALSKKYDTTLSDVSVQIETAQKELGRMIGNLTGNDYDMAGLAEFRKLLGGE